jgi:TetR/AcrR family transcriptional regulator, cholesterol catabolism regulator
MFSHISPLSDRKQEILNEATALFSQKGYVAASMRDLAKQLNIKPASLYSHYDSKEVILWEIALRCARDFHDAVLPLAAGQGSPGERLEGMIRAHLAAIIRNMDAASIFFREWAHLNEPLRTEYAGLIARYEAGFASVIQEGIDEGSLRDLRPKFVTAVLLSSVNWIHQWYRPSGSMSQAVIGDQLVLLLLSGLRAG